MGNCISLRIGPRKTSKYMVNEFYSDNKEVKTEVTASNSEVKKKRRLPANDSFGSESSKNLDNNQNVSVVDDIVRAVDFKRDFRRECETSIHKKYSCHENDNSLICTPSNHERFEVLETETPLGQCNFGEIQPMPTPLLSNAPFTPGRQIEQFYSTNGKPRKSQEVKEYIQRKRLATRNNIVEEL